MTNVGTMKKMGTVKKVGTMKKMGTVKKVLTVKKLGTVISGSSVVECRTRNQVSPGSNSPLLPFGRLGIFLLSIDAPVDSAV